MFRDIGTEVVDIYAGPERKHFVVHKNLLTTQSEYFNKALTGNFLEAEEKSIHLKEEDPAAVALLISKFSWIQICFLALNAHWERKAFAVFLGYS